MKLPALIATGLLAAGSALAQPAKTTTTLANPAATFCVENGGVYEIKSDTDGNQSGLCVFPDGAKIDAWDFLRAHFEGN